MDKVKFKEIYLGKKLNIQLRIKEIIITKFLIYLKNKLPFYQENSQWLLVWLLTYTKFNKTNPPSTINKDLNLDILAIFLKINIITW